MAVVEEVCELSILAARLALMLIARRDYPQVAPRSVFSVLDAAETYRLSGIEPTHWRIGWRVTLAAMADGA